MCVSRRIQHGVVRRFYPDLLPMRAQKTHEHANIVTNVRVRWFRIHSSLWPLDFKAVNGQLPVRASLAGMEYRESAYQWHLFSNTIWVRWTTIFPHLRACSLTASGISVGQHRDQREGAMIPHSQYRYWHPAITYWRPAINKGMRVNLEK